MSPARPFIFSALQLLVLVLTLGYLGEAQAKHFDNEWVAEIKGGRNIANDVAMHHDFEIIEELRGLDDHYVLKRQDVPHRSKRSASHHTQKLVDDHRVSFVEQQHLKERVKRGSIKDRREIARDIVKHSGSLDDPTYSQMWYLNPEPSKKRDNLVTDMKVRDVWAQGITGKNSVVCILDDGLESNHTDLKDNYDPNASFDINDNDTDPFPRYDITNENKHGTRCAGEVSMAANNENCGVGIAFDSRIGGIRMLDGKITDRTEAFSLAFNRDYIDIYSASWGPNDDGKTTELPGRLTMKALQEGVEKGRNGKGSIFAWASGNGGRLGDNCNSDGYTSSIYTLSVSSATQSGKSPWYAEKCASTLSTTYSSGGYDEQKIISTDLHNQCTHDHTGTSAAAPIAAGIVALLLEVNPDLTWRDVQHITVHASDPDPLLNEEGWYSNAVGYCANLAFGFGLMNAAAMVEMADPKKWVAVGEQHICRVEITNDVELPREFKSGEFVEVEFKTDGCEGQEQEVNFLEHVQVVLNLDHERRGNIYAELVSPSGTITSLMQERHFDKSTLGFKDFPLSSVHTWGEDPSGTWKFRVADKSDDDYKGKLNSAQLVMYGTKEKPAYREGEEKIDRCGEIKPSPSVSSVVESTGGAATLTANEMVARLNAIKGMAKFEDGKSQNIIEVMIDELSGKDGNEKVDLNEYLGMFGFVPPQ